MKFNQNLKDNRTKVVQFSPVSVGSSNGFEVKEHGINLGIVQGRKNSAGKLNGKRNLLSWSR